MSKNQHAASITTLSGTPTNIHSKKPISMLNSFFMYATRRAFGGVPMMVPTEPIEAA